MKCTCWFSIPDSQETVFTDRYEFLRIRKPGKVGSGAVMSRVFRDKFFLPDIENVNFSIPTATGNVRAIWTPADLFDFSKVLSR